MKLDLPTESAVDTFTPDEYALPNEGGAVLDFAFN